jgi:hypothetical protein
LKNVIKMSFVRTKNINGNQYYYLVKNERINGVVRQKCLKYLGKTKNQNQ